MSQFGYFGACISVIASLIKFELIKSEVVYEFKSVSVRAESIPGKLVEELVIY